MKKHDAIYARYSSHAQDDGTSIEVQIEQCERAAGGACTHYIDRAKTGRAMGGREQLLKLLADCEAGKIARVFVYKFDRVGRAAESHVVAQQLDDLGVELISATEGTNALARGIQLVVAEDYSRQLATRTRDGLIKRFEQSGFTGGPTPYGYRSVQRGTMKALEIDPAEAEVVREMVHEYLCNGSGFKRIAKRLRERGIVTRKGNPFCFTSIRAVLINPILCGRVQYNVRRMALNRSTGRRVPRRKGIEEVRERVDETLRIIDNDTFNAMQAKLQLSSRGHVPKAASGLSPFTGIVYCACGAKMYRAKSKNAKGLYYYYQCSRKQRYDDCELSRNVREDVLMEKVQATLGVLFRRSDEIIAKATQYMLAAVESNRGEAERLRRELVTIDRKHAAYAEQTIDPGVPSQVKSVLYRQMADLETRRAEIAAALENLHDDANDITEDVGNFIREELERAKEMLSGATTSEAFNSLVHELIGPIELTADGRLQQRELPSAEAKGSLPSNIAGGGFEPSSIAVFDSASRVF